MDLIEQFVRRYARRTTQSGKVVIVTNGDPLFLAAFKHLSWPDPYIDPELLPRSETASVEAPEKAVLPKSKVRLLGGV